MGGFKNAALLSTASIFFLTSYNSLAQSNEKEDVPDIVKRTQSAVVVQFETFKLHHYPIRTEVSTRRFCKLDSNGESHETNNPPGKRVPITVWSVLRAATGR